MPAYTNLYLLSPWLLTPCPLALYSMRNLTRPSLTHYELDSKSPCMAVHCGPGLLGWDGEGTHQEHLAPGQHTVLVYFLLL